MTSGPRHVGYERSDVKPGDVVAVPKWLADAMNPPMPNDRSQGCKDCGQEHVRQGKRTCNAHRSRKQLPDGSPKLPCKNFPPAGLPVCRFHGGAAPQVEHKGVWRHFEAEVQAVARDITNDVLTTDPYVFLPEQRPQKGGHKKPNSRSAQRARRQRETYRRDKPLTS